MPLSASVPPAQQTTRARNPLVALTQPLYVRIWLAVVLAVAVLTLLVGWAWRLATEPPLREVVIRNEAGQIIGSGQTRHPRPPVAQAEGESAAGGPPMGGPEFTVRMEDGRVMHMHLPRPPRSPWSRAPFGFFWTLGLVAVAVALATYPIVRRLTRRLEALREGVEQWGAGDLSTRVPVQGADEVGFLAERFNHAAERIELLVQSHKSLLANASHELRSPLTRIRMGLELMGHQPSESFKQEIKRNINELDQLIDEILLASRLDAREADMGTVELVDLTGLAAEECARVDAELETGGSSSTVEVPGVAKLLRRVIRNLLENARRYSDGEVHLAVLQQGDSAVLRVSDRGPGVPEALRERIFEPFYRLPGASEREGGVGLGLALVKSIAIRHNGQVLCSENPGGGAVFTVTLPRTLAATVQKL